jgi:hypothetical protein
MRCSSSTSKAIPLTMRVIPTGAVSYYHTFILQLALQPIEFLGSFFSEEAICPRLVLKFERKLPRTMDFTAEKT